MNEHKSRFKAYLIPRSELAGEAARLAPLLEKLAELELSEPEKILLFIFIYAQARKPDEWFMSRGHFSCSLTHEGFQFSTLPEEFNFLKKVFAANLDEFVARYGFKKLPGSVLQTLAGWRSGKYKLVLKDTAITPLEMLKLQARGERAVTLDFAAAMSGSLVDGARDAFDFLLHDLVHADLYFGEGHLQQREFFAQFLRVMESGEFDEGLQTDPEFVKDVHYLISDMNSHVDHMAAQLKACLVKHHLVKENKQYDESLSSAGRLGLETLVHRLNYDIFQNGRSE